MTRSARCLDSCLRLLRPRLSRNFLKHKTARNYGQAAYGLRQETPYRGNSETSFRSRREGRPRQDMEDNFDSRGVSGRGQHSTTYLAEHLNHLFSPLKFPSDLAHRILTHASHSSAREGHNASLSFQGRRVLEAYLNLFLTGSSALRSSHDLEAIANHTLNTNLLGQEIGSKWGFGRIIQWVPAVSPKTVEDSEDQEQTWRRIGLYKVQGDGVVATIGGIFNQFGGSVAHRVFHTRMLPLLLVHGGLPVPFHQEALAVCERMGGSEGKLLIGTDRSNRERLAQ